MRIVFKIAKNELRYLFYSPVAWFVLIVFFVECAVFYANPVYDIANYQDVLLKNSPGFKGFSDPPLTIKVFIEQGLFQNIISNLYLFIPVFTMGLINRETNSGSIRLLYSSPVSLRKIVLGKYLGIMLYNMLLVAITGLFMVIGVMNIQHIDYGLLLSAALGFYLLVCAYSAIGLFMSTLSTYQVVCALSTFAVIFVLSRIGGLWQRYDFVRDITYFISLQNRTLKMLSGLIVTRDIIYFIVIALLLLCFTIIKLRGEREALPWYIKAQRYVLVMVAALLIGYTASRPALTGYFDMTATHANTIPKEMQDIIRELGDSSLEVTLYTNLLSDGLARCLPEARNADYMSVMWEPYLRFKPDIKFKYEYYYDYDAQSTDSVLFRQFGTQSLKEIASQFAEAVDADLSMFRSPEEMQGIPNLKREFFRPVMQLKYRGRTELLRTFPDTKFWPDLNNVAAVLMRLLHPDKIPRLYFVKGELERNIYRKADREYASHTTDRNSRSALVNLGFDVDTLNLSVQDPPANATALVVADPRMEISATVQRKIRNYIDAGGNLFIMGKPHKQYVINPILEQLGVRLMPGQLVEPTYDETPDKIQPYMTAAAGDLSKMISWMKKSVEVDKDSLNVLMPGATGLQYDGGSMFKIEPLLATKPGRVWLKADNLVIDSILPPFNAATGDLKQASFVTAVGLSRRIGNKDQRIAVCGDADFASNMRLGFKFNMLFLMPVYHWMDHDEFAINFSTINPRDTLLKISAPVAKGQKIILIWVMPVLILLSGGLLLTRRKRR